MAEGVATEIKGDTPEIPTESQDMEQLLCQLCKDFGQQLPAEGYCETCQDHLCSTCLQTHTKPRTSRNHVLKGKHEMPAAYKKKVATHVKGITCIIHVDYELVLYCKSHDQLCCAKCIRVSHGVCSDVKPIAEVAKGIEDVAEFKQFMEKVDTLEQSSKVNIQRAAVNERKINTYYTECVDDFSAAVVKIKDNDLSNVKSVQAISESVVEQLNVWKGDVQNHRDNKKEEQLFIIMKLSKKELELMEKNSAHVAKENKIEQYGFVSTDEATAIGKVVRLPYLVKQINVKHTSETNNCGIMNIMLLDENLMLVADQSRNYSIKLVNTNNNEVLSYTKLTTCPWEMTMTDDKQVYVTMPDGKKLLHLMAPTTDLGNSRELQLDGQCYCVDYVKDSLKVDLRSPTRIVDLDLNGKVKRTVHDDTTQLKNDKGEHFLTNTLHSVHNAATDTVIYSDHTESSIVEMSNDGKARLIVKSTKLSNPRGIVMGDDGSYIVCLYTGKRIVRVSDDGDIQDLITNLEFYPYSVAADKKKRLLYVGGHEFNSVNVYKLKTL